MQTVHDTDGRRLLLVKRSAESSLVRDPETGDERYVPNDELDPVDESPLDAAARAVPEDVRRITTAAPSRRGLGLLVELDRRGPVAVRDLLADYDLCESDLHGLLASFAAAGLVAETDVAGERGYRLTDVGEAGVHALRE